MIRLSLVLLLLLLCSFQSFAGNVWYHGKITNMSTYGDNGSFYVDLDNSLILSHCKYGRVYAMTGKLGIERTKLASSIALTALVSQKDFGVVVDLPSGADNTCYISATTNHGASIKP